MKWSQRYMRWRSFRTYETALEHVQRERLRKLEEGFSLCRAHLMKEDRDRARANVTVVDADLRREAIFALVSAYGGESRTRDTTYRDSPNCMDVFVSLALDAAQMSEFNGVACEREQECGRCHRCYRQLLAVLQVREKAYRAPASR